MFVTKVLLFLFLFLSVYFSDIYSQGTGTIFGKVVDKLSGEFIIGANVLLEGTTIGAATDLDGNYTIKNVPSGSYSLIVSYISYSKSKVENVQVNADELIRVDVPLTPEAIEVGEVIVIEEASMEYEAALLNQRKKSTQISDGISAEQIKRSTDNTTAETLRRVPGLTLLDNKYIYVRGVSERYNGALLNNSPLASSEPDKRDFAFDLIPANLIENTVVVKSFTPDEPGDFSGGLVKVNTVEFPSKTIFSFSYSTSYVNDVSTKSFKTYEGSSTDYFGVDDGFRDVPEGIPDPLTFRSYDQNPNDTNRTYWSTKFNDKWGLQDKKAFLNQAFGITFGEKFNLFGNDFGLISSLTYKVDFESKDVITKDIENEENGTYFFDYAGKRTTRDVYWGGIVNLSYRIGELHKIGLKNIVTVKSDDEVTELQGFKYDYQDERQTTALRFISRNLYSGQLSGTSFFPVITGIHLDWRASYSSTNRSEPDYRRATYTRDIADSNSTVPFLAYLPIDPEQFASGRFYSDLDEYKRAIGIDLGQDLGLLKIKYGANHFNTSRSFDARSFGVTDPYGYSRLIIGGYALDSVFSVKNFEDRYIMMREYYNPSNVYSGSDNLFGYYLMAEIPFGLLNQDFDLIAGLRVENYELRLRSTSPISQGSMPIFVDNFNSDILPAISLIYKLNEASNVRFSFSKTINRPNFREIAPFTYYNFEDQTLVSGNTELVQANIANYDIRFETFPGIGELISASVFLKELRNPIEKVFVVSTGQNDRSFDNASFARNVGFELEYRTNLGRILGALNNFNITANYTRIWSEIEETNIGTGRSVRPMQGQSPYVINAALNYQNFDLSFSLNIAYNKFGKRIIETANFAGSDIYEYPRDVIDLVLIKELGQHIVFKFSIKDLLSQPFEYFEDNTLVRKYTANTKLTLGVSYNL
ncbi:MAG: TonB-dependent receptor [Ignavibacteriaceae bacterium]|nr:TonB-dependent receptor [Ignavibacteriaceae bacterium]